MTDIQQLIYLVAGKQILASDDIAGIHQYSRIIFNGFQPVKRLVNIFSPGQRSVVCKKHAIVSVHKGCNGIRNFVSARCGIFSNRDRPKPQHRFRKDCGIQTDPGNGKAGRHQWMGVGNCQYIRIFLINP